MINILSKILHSTILTPLYDLKIKLIDLECLCENFVLKFLEPHYFQNLRWILFMYGLMIDIGPKFLHRFIPIPYMISWSKSWTKNFSVKVLH